MGEVAAELPILRRLQPALRKGEWKVTIALHKGNHDARHRILDIWPGFHEGALYGLAIDLGSTTICLLYTSQITKTDKANKNAFSATGGRYFARFVGLPLRTRCLDFWLFVDLTGPGLFAVVACPDATVFQLHRELGHGRVGRGAQGAAVADIEAGTMQLSLIHI